MKVAPYGLEGLGKGLKYYADLAAQRISPPLLKEAESYIKKQDNKKILKNVQFILSSPQKRAIQTAKLMRMRISKNIPVRISKSLNEVPFSLDGLDPKTYSSTVARSKFLQDFISDKLLEQRRAVKDRIKEVLKANAKGGILCVTHTFLMKIIETCIKYPDLFEHPKKLARNFNVNQRLFEYCGMLKLAGKEIKQTLNKLQ